MRIPVVLLALLATLQHTPAQTDRYVTARADGVNSGQVTIPDNEVGELVWSPNSARLIRDGFTNSSVVPANNAASGRGCIVTGPAVFSTEGTTKNYILTVKLTPSAYPADKTVILPPGTNQVYVGLESSTNLVHWAPATNGIYGSPDEARFFRIHMQNQ